MRCFIMSTTRNLPCFCGSNLKHKYCHKDIAFDSAFSYLIKIYSKCSSELKNINNNNFKCSKGCSSCCYEHFAVPSAEFIYALYGYSLKYGIEKTKNLLTRGSNIWKEFEVQYPQLATIFSTTPSKHVTDYISYYYNTISQITPYMKTPCLFLDKDGSCSIYDFRPLICRQYPYGITSEQYVCPKMNTDFIKNNLTPFNNSKKLYEKYFICYHSEFLNSTICDLPKPMIYISNVLINQKDNISSVINNFKNISKESQIKSKYNSMKK